MLADARQIHEPIDRAQQMIARDVPLQVEAVEQRFLRHRSLTHHRLVSARSRKLNQDSTATSSSSFSTQSTHLQSFAPDPLQRQPPTQLQLQNVAVMPPTCGHARSRFSPSQWSLPDVDANHSSNYAPPSQRWAIVMRNKMRRRPSNRGTSDCLNWAGFSRWFREWRRHTASAPVRNSGCSTAPQT
jgi:hypothetical protein